MHRIVLAALKTYLIGQLDTIDVGSPREEQRSDVLQIDVVLCFLLSLKDHWDREVVQARQCRVGAASVLSERVAMRCHVYTKAILQS